MPFEVPGGFTNVRQQSLNISTGGNSQALAVSTVSAQTAAIASGVAVISCTVDCFVRQGVDPTALSNGTDQRISGGQDLRVNVTPGNKIAFIVASGSGTFYITQDV